MVRVSSQKITAKQLVFAEGVANGLTLSDAYRKAYDSARMKPASVHANACRLAKNVKVIARVKEIEAKKAEEYSIKALSDKERVLKKLRDLMDGADNQAVQLNAAIWLGKTHAAFTDVVTDNKQETDIAKIDKEIAQRIAELEAKQHNKSARLKLVNE